MSGVGRQSVYFHRKKSFDCFNELPSTLSGARTGTVFFAISFRFNFTFQGYVCFYNLLAIKPNSSSDMRFPTIWYVRPAKIVSEYDQEIPQSQTADNAAAPRGRAAQPSRDTRKTN